MGAWHPLIGPVLTAQQYAARLAFAREHQNWPAHRWRPILLRAGSHWECDRSEIVCICHRECSAASNVIQYDQFGGGWSGEEYTWEGHKNVLSNGRFTAVRYWDEFLRATVRPDAAGVGPGFLLVHDNECVGSLWMMMVLMLFTGLHNPQTCIQLKTSGMLRIRAFTATNNTTDCPGAHWCPDPGLAETPPGYHPLSHQEHA